MATQKRGTRKAAASSRPAGAKNAASTKAAAARRTASAKTAPAKERAAAKKSAARKTAATASKKATAKTRGRKAAAVWTQPSSSGGWEVLVQGNARASSRHATKAEAVAAGRQRAVKLKAEHVIKTKDGKIAARNSYGGDPRGRKG